MRADETSPLAEILTKAVGYLFGSGIVFAGYAVIALTV